MRRTKLWSVILAGLGLISLAACGGSAGADDAAAKAKRPVLVAPVGRADLDEVLRYVADLQPQAEVRVFSPVPDRILYFPWADGEEIQRGERIALIRKEGLEKGLEQIVAQMEALDVQLKNLSDELARAKERLAAGGIPQQTYDKLNTNYLATQAQRRALDASRGQLAVTANNAVITSPITGIIAQKSLETGDMAVPQLPLCSVMAIDKLKALLRLVEEDVPKVRLGQSVSLTLDAFPGETFVGVVTSIRPYLDVGTRTNTIEVSIDNAKIPETGHRRLKPGMFGRAEIIVAKKTQVLVAPEPALLLDTALLEAQQSGEVLRKAFVVSDKGLAIERRLHLGARQGSVYEVLDGLAEGEQLIVRGQHGLKDGQAVEIVSGNAS